MEKLRNTEWSLELLHVKCEAMDSGCIEWQWRRDRKGYGHTHFRGQDDRTHRVAWVLMHGDIPPGMCVLHRCDNPPCCNPDHLFLGTNLDNVVDRISKGRYTNRRGDSSPRRKLTSSDVLRIRSGDGSPARIRAFAAEFGITRQAVWSAFSGKNWGHL